MLKKNVKENSESYLRSKNSLNGYLLARSVIGSESDASSSRESFLKKKMKRLSTNKTSKKPKIL